MNELNVKNLRSNFPLLYPDVHPLRRREYFECGDGWYKIIRHLSEDLENEIVAWKQANPTDTEPPCMVQCKEKFGRLYFYMHKATDKMYQLIAEASSKTLETCEDCGEPGKLRKGGWIRVLCDEHANNREAFERDPLER